MCLLGLVELLTALLLKVIILKFLKCQLLWCCEPKVEHMFLKLGCKLFFLRDLSCITYRLQQSQALALQPAV